MHYLYLTLLHMPACTEYLTHAVTPKATDTADHTKYLVSPSSTSLLMLRLMYLYHQLLEYAPLSPWTHPDCTWCLSRQPFLSYMTYIRPPHPCLGLHCKQVMQAWLRVHTVAVNACPGICTQKVIVHYEACFSGLLSALMDSSAPDAASTPFGGSSQLSKV